MKTRGSELRLFFKKEICLLEAFIWIYDSCDVGITKGMSWTKILNKEWADEKLFLLNIKYYITF